MDPIARRAQEGWLRFWGLMRRYHRYEVRGFENLRGGPALLVGYHGRPLAFDQCMLTTVIHERMGYLPHGVIHGAFRTSPTMAKVIDGLGFVTGDGPAIAAAVEKGEHILVQPGGTREGCRSSKDRYRVDWGDRTGYLRLALRYRLPIVPVAGTGVDDAFIGLNNGYTLGKLLGAPAGVPVWLGLGLGVWPFALPLPVKMTQVIGAPIHLDTLLDPATGRAVDGKEPEPLQRLHRKIARAVQALLDEANPRSEVALAS